MSNFNFYKAEKAYGELYLQFPKVFLYSDKYKDLSDSAKIAYVVFKDRLQYSIKNNWVDEEGHVYFIFTNKELMTLLDCSKNKIIKIKNELENHNLLLQVKRGYDHKKKRNLPNRLYLADLDVEPHEVYAYQNVEQTLDNSGIPKYGVPEQEAKTLDNSGIPKYGIPEKESRNLVINGVPQNEQDLYKYNIKDYKDYKESHEGQNQLLEKSLNRADEEKALQNNLIDQFIEEKSLESMYGDEVIGLMKVYSFNDFKTFETYSSKLYFAHKSVIEELNFNFILDPIFTNSSKAMRIELKNAFQRAVQQYKKGNIKTDFNNYLFGVFKSTFIEFGESIKKEKESADKELPPVPIFNWIDEDFEGE